LAETSSASISLWWDSAVLDIMDKLFTFALPIEDDWDLRLKVCQILKYFDQLLQVSDRISSSSSDSITSRVKSLLRLRYKEDFMSYHESISNGRASISSICETCNQRCLDQHDDDSNAKLRSTAERFVTVMQEIVEVKGTTYDNAAAVYCLKLADYIEDVLSFIDGINPPALYLLFWLHAV
jgi:hypothetical protein